MLIGKIIYHTIMRRPTLNLKVSKRKLRKTYTLSSEALAILEEERKERHVESTSSALEEILKERGRQKQMANIATSISNYYDSLSEEEMNEDRLWGAFAESQFSLE